LNYDTANGTKSWCYGDAPNNCAVYGRLYQYSTALVVCPKGWHLPMSSEWDTMIGHYAIDSMGARLMAKSTLWSSILGSDDFGFAALPGGYKDVSGNRYSGKGFAGTWWTASPDERTPPSAYRTTIDVNSDISSATNLASQAMSVRCLAN